MIQQKKEIQNNNVDSVNEMYNLIEYRNNYDDNNVLSIRNNNKRQSTQ